MDIDTLPVGVFPRLPMDEATLAKIKEARAEKSLCLTALDAGTKEPLRRSAHKARKDMTREDVIRRWPALVSHVICESLGYATPDTAALIIQDAMMGRENWCEWIYSCYNKNPMKAVKDAIRTRRYHKGYMAEFKHALALVFREMITGEAPMFASWF